MAQNEPNGIPVSYNRHQNLVRLLELPPDLLELIEASSAPKCVNLTFKSALAPQSTGSAKTNTSNAPASHVVLTANDKTYQLRQVQTSNSVLLLESVDHGLAISAQCTSTLELEDTPTIDASGQAKSAQQYLRAALPIYTTPADLEDSDTTLSTRTAIFADIPLSDAELHIAWVQLVAFEVHSHGSHAWQPAATALRDLWRAILSAATIKGIDLSAQIHSSTLWDAVESEHPRELFDALLQRLKSADSSGARDEEAITFDAQAVVAWVCQLCPPANETGKSQEAQQQTWTARCQDLLPDAWHRHVEAAVQTALVAGPALTVGVIGGEALATDATNKSADKRGPTGPQRDWHARFKMAKR